MPRSPVPHSLDAAFPDGPRRILIVRMSHLGDVAQTLALYHPLRERWPDAEFGWAIQPEFAPLIDPLARVFPFERLGGFRAWPRIRRAIRAWGPDVALDAQGNWKSAACTRLSGAPLKFGFDLPAWQEPLAARFSGAARMPGSDASTPRIHLVDRCRALASFVTGRPVNDSKCRFDPALTDAEKARGAELLRATLLSLEDPTVPRPLVILHPGVEGDPRTWPAARFRALAVELIARGTEVLILTGPGEATVGTQLQADVPDAAHLVGQRGLRELAALFSAAATRRATLFVSDSGPAHVAASVGLGVRLLAGPEDPARTGPWPLNHPDLRGPHRVVGAGGQPGWFAPRAITEIRCEDALAASEVVLSGSLAQKQP